MSESMCAVCGEPAGQPHKMSCHPADRAAAAGRQWPCGCPESVDLRARVADARRGREAAEERAAGLEAAFRWLLAIYEDDIEPTPRPDWVVAALSAPGSARDRYTEGHAAGLQAAYDGEVRPGWLAEHDATMLREWQPCPRCHEAVRGWPDGACPACGARAMLPGEVAEVRAQAMRDAAELLCPGCAAGSAVTRVPMGWLHANGHMCRATAVAALAATPGGGGAT